MGIIITDLSKELIKRGNLVSFGNALENQIDIFDYKTKNGQTVLQRLYEGSKYNAFEDILNNGLCYVEYPTSRWQGGELIVTYDKYLATRSVSLMVKWLGLADELELPERYTKNLSKTTEKGYCYIIKPTLGNGKDKPNKITVPTKPVNLEDPKLRIYPVEVLNALFERVKSMSENGIVQLEYLKDNRTKRVLNTTTSSEILNKIYSEEEHVSMMLSGVTENFLTSSTLGRGYVRVIEADSSRYDQGVRSLNLARVVGVKEVDFSELDLSYVSVDLRNVVASFGVCIRNLNQNDLKLLYETIKGWEYQYEGGYSIYDLESWAIGKEAVHSTTFQRALHDFMVTNERFFSGYNGDGVLTTEKDTQEENKNLFELEEDFSLFDV